jgi:hypothetical protein
MERREDVTIVDLDQAAAVVADRRPGWSELGVIVDSCTWMDQEDDWPQTLHTDRSNVRRPRSLGVRIHRPAGEAQVVLYAGGWADADSVRFDRDDRVTHEYVEIDSPAGFADLLDRLVGVLTTDL